MSLYKDASLVMIPSAYKDGKLYSIRPTDGSGDFTFSRGSNLAATRVDVNGLIEKGRENLVTYSNQFNNWDIDSIATLTGNQSGYNGNDAWYVVPSNFNGTHIVRKSSVVYQGLQTYSVYAKTAGYDIQLRATGIGGTNFWVSYDLTNGVVGTTGGGQIDAVITSVGNGWYRCSMAMESGAYTPHIGIYIVEDGATAPQSPSFAGNGSGVYIQDAQVEIGLVATDYIETGASTAQAGILEDMPRLDYSGGASCPALLLEPQRTNLFDHSEYLSTGSGWADYSTTITPNAAISPEGVQNATGMEIIDSQSRLQFNAAQGAGTYTFSVYARSDSPVNMRLRPSVDGVYEVLYFTTTSEWTRYEITFTATTSVGLCQIRSYQEVAGNIEIYGFQLEAGSYPTSYIPTYGSSVTRSADSDGSGVDVSSLVSTNYTCFYEIDPSQFSGGTTWIGQQTSGGACWQVYGGTMIVRTSSGVSYPFGHAAGTRTKVAVVYDGETIYLYKDGAFNSSALADNTRWGNFTNIELSFDNNNLIRYNQVAVFPTALTSSEAIALTTL